MAVMLKIKNWIYAHKTALLLAVIVPLLAGIGWYFLRPISPESTARVSLESSTQPEKALTKPVPLTGIEVEPAIANRPVTGVMIENSPNARPQSGLNDADVVFETVTEGGITRFLALYQQHTPKKLGPVRSVRVPFVDWFMGFDAAIAHVGGAAEALQLINRRNARDLDQFKHAGPYYRTGDRHAPHNMYTSMKGLRSLQLRLGYRQSKFKDIPRSDDNPAESPDAPRVTIDFSSSLYQAQFRYHAGSNSYRRYMAGSPHIDRETGKAITVKNVVVAKMRARQQGQYVMFDTIGKGQAILFKDGRAHKVTWRQQNPRERIELINSKGEQVPLNRGNTWFAVVPRGRPVNY